MVPCVPVKYCCNISLMFPKAADMCTRALILNIITYNYSLTYTYLKGKGKFLYSAVSSPQDHSKRFTLYFPDRPVQSDTISASLGSIQPHLMGEGCLYTYPPLSIARYSFIKLSELEQCRVKKLAQGFKTTAQHSNLCSRIRQSEALPLSHCAR